MAESSEVQALEKISTEVGESQIKITLSSQCIKAQAFLVDKLRKQIERQKEICSFISNSNFKLQAEIKQAELEIKSLIISQETIKSGNIELKKELLLAKEKKLEIAERIGNGEKKYETLWLESKERYESIPFVQKVLQATGRMQILKENIISLENQSCHLVKEFKTKKEFFANLDRDRIIEIADFFINFVPNAVKSIQEKRTAINEISKELNKIAQDQEAFMLKQVNTTPVKQQEIVCDETKNIKPTNDDWLNITTNSERDMITMPRLQFKNSDFDVLNAKLDQIKIMKVEIHNTGASKRLNPIESVTDYCNKRMKEDEFSVFFNNRTPNDNNDQEYKAPTYANRKLINILDDVKLDKNDTCNIVSKVDFEKLKGVNMIGKDNLKENYQVSDKKENETIEELDLTKPNTENNNSSILIPPTQFLDLSQEKLSSNSQQVEVIVHMSMNEPSSEKLRQSLKNSQESVHKKRVSFDLPLSIQEITNKTNDDELTQRNMMLNNEANETIDSPFDISTVSNESYSKIKDMIFKKHNLDLSPQFTYAKNRLMQMNTDESIITSKFFKTEEEKNTDEPAEDKKNITQVTNNSKEHKVSEISSVEAPDLVNEARVVAMDVDQVVVSSPKASKISKTENAVSGFLFNHSTQGIPDSLNVSISTTGFEEGDTDFPHCIDSSLLLSPKADLPMPMSGDNVDVTSQEVPNFLSGLRKTGLSFFGHSTTEPKPDTSAQNQGNSFNFNFNSGEPKSRGGLFSMFR